MHEPTSPEPLGPMPNPATVDLPAESRPFWKRWIIDRNPMFLISGVFMLAGCFLVSRHIHEIDPAQTSDGNAVGLLIGLLVVLNLYEFAVIGLGLVLSRSRSLVRDARHLIGLALLLLLDAAFVYNETGIASLHAGILIAGVGTLLSWLKVGLISHYLGLRPTRRAAGVTAITLAAMYALPVVVRAAAGDGFLDPAHALAVWCGVGVIVALHALPGSWGRITHAQSDDQRQLQHLVCLGVIALPLLSLIAHAGAALWVFENGFEPAMLSPILLGLAVLLLRHHRVLGGARPTAHAATLIVASAIVASLMPGEGLIAVSQTYYWVAISPLRGVLMIAPLILAWAWWIGSRSPAGLVNTLLPMFAAALGHTPGAMLRQGWLLLEHGYAIFASLIPQGKLQWGAVAIAIAFGCLVIGGLLSWWHRSRERARLQVSELLAAPS